MYYNLTVTCYNLRNVKHKLTASCSLSHSFQVSLFPTCCNSHNLVTTQERTSQFMLSVFVNINDWIFLKIEWVIGSVLYTVCPDSCTVGTGSFLGLKWPPFGAALPTPFSAELGMGRVYTCASPLHPHKHVIDWSSPYRVSYGSKYNLDSYNRCYMC